MKRYSWSFSKSINFYQQWFLTLINAETINYRLQFTCKANSHFFLCRQNLNFFNCFYRLNLNFFSFYRLSLIFEREIEAELNSGLKLPSICNREYEVIYSRSSLFPLAEALFCADLKVRSQKTWKNNSATFRRAERHSQCIWQRVVIKRGARPEKAMMGIGPNKKKKVTQISI